MEKEIEINNLVKEARNEISLPHAIDLLKNAEKLAFEWVNVEGGVVAYQALSLVLTELAKNTESPRDRDALWERTLLSCEKGWRTNKHPSMAIEFGIRTIDFIEDQLNIKALYEIQQDEIQNILSNSKNVLDDSLKKTDRPNIRANLLASKSAILRFSTLFLASGKYDKKVKAKEALRCAERAVQEGGRRGENSHQEGLSLWFLSRYAAHDAEYSQLIKRAEDSFWTAYDTGDNIHNLLTLSRFFRFTHRPDACCDIFKEYLSIENQKRRAWQNSYIYGEAIVQLWYGERPREFILEHCNEAEILLRQALDSGYVTARNILALAFIKACKDEKVGGEEILNNLFTKDGSISWKKAIETAQESILDDQFSYDLITKGFALGINQGIVWNALGTFVSSFLRDVDLSEKLYRIAIKLAKNDPIPLTNLARLLVQKGGKNNLQEAKKLVDRAKRQASKRFIWWRVVESSIKEEDAKKPSKPYEHRIDKLPRIKSVKDIRKQFKILERMADHQLRGNLFEQLMHSLLEISLGNAIGSHKLQYGAKSTQQIDNAAFFNKEYYLIEVKWRNEKAVEGDILNLINRMDVFGQWGLFISMAGFAPNAVETAKKHMGINRVLLMDGEELELVLYQFIMFDELIIQKQHRLYIDRNPYYKITPITLSQTI